MLRFASEIGPLPTAGSSTVIAVSCSSTIHPSYSCNCKSLEHGGDSGRPLTERCEQPPLGRLE